MNNRGQTLIFFVLVIPILLLILAFIVDTGLVLKEYTRFTSTTRTIVRTVDMKTENYQEKVKNLYDKNNIPTKNLEIETIEKQIQISNEYEIESIFGNIIGLKSYKIKKTIKYDKE